MKKDTVLHSDTNSEEGIETARQYIKNNNLTSDDVKIVKRGDQVCVVAKRDIEFKESEPQANEGSVVRVIDFETTGIPSEEKQHSVIEAAFVDVSIKPGTMEIVKEWKQLVIPTTEMDIMARAVHHICPERAKAEGWEWQDAIEEMTNDSVIYCAHNADFEKKFFNPKGKWIDTYKVALKLWPDAPSHSNQALKYYLEIEDYEEQYPPHRALPDCRVTADILMDILEEISIDEAVEISNNPPYLTKIYFGKHKGEKFEDLPRDYINWLNKQNDLDEGVKAAVSRILNGAA